MNVYNLAKVDQQWSATAASALFSEYAHADEGHFQRMCLAIGLPLVFKGLYYRPLCAEFPANPADRSHLRRR